MRDSRTKRALVTVYLNFWEFVRCVGGALRDQKFVLVEPNYDDYWVLREEGTFQPRFSLIGRGMERRASVLDVGCGDGAMLQYLMSRNDVCGLGIDTSAVAVQRARARGVNARVQTLTDLCEESDEGAYDDVVLSEVIEHVASPEAMIRDAWKLCRARMWLTFPNIAYYPHRLRLLCGRFPVQWAVFPGEHLRFWSLRDIEHWLNQLGFPERTFLPSNGLTLFNLHRFWPNLLANQIVVRLDKKVVTV